MLDQHNAGRVRSLHSSQRKHPPHTRWISFSLSRGPLLPPLLPREKNPNPNPRIQNLSKCFQPKPSALSGYLTLLMTTGSYSEASQTRELPVPGKKIRIGKQLDPVISKP